MRFLSLLSLTLIAIPAIAQQPPHHWSIAIHGGAGVIERSALGPEGDVAYRDGLAQALAAGVKVLDSGGTSLDAVEAVIHVLEDDPHFNAGRGAVFTREGKNEMDSSIMDGATLKAGAVASVTRTRHPISLARAVMEKSPYVMMDGPGADAFSIQIGLVQADPAFFFTESRWQSLIKQLQKENLPIPARPAGVPPPPPTPVDHVAQLNRDFIYDESADSHSYGTVGVVALDRAGNLAAGTSTGGLQGKMPGRVGDSPIIGAGTYANNSSCAVSATGSGEYFIRLGVAREICNLVLFKGLTIQQAADEVIHHELESLHGDGGVIALTPDGQSAFSFNTPGMFRARQSENSKPEIKIYADEQ